MSEDRQAYIRAIVAAAPALSREDADTVRGLLPLASRHTAGPAPTTRQPQTTGRTAA